TAPPAQEAMVALGAGAGAGAEILLPVALEGASQGRGGLVVSVTEAVAAVVQALAGRCLFGQAPC
ncbi:MAG TPA: hypothetical protein PLI09_11035, partial [Candidatus Hydrogenedentes bacterium]|nr:hypothetical protein [Candidatus Hydrogenedentota bacterium]